MNKVFLIYIFMTKYNTKNKGIVHIFLIYEQSPNFMYLFYYFPQNHLPSHSIQSFLFWHFFRYFQESMAKKCSPSSYDSVVSVI